MSRPFKISGVERQTMNKEDKVRFIRQHAMEIQPILSDSERETLDMLLGNDTAEDDKEIDAIVERFETKIFFHEKSIALPEGKRVLISMNDNGAYTAASPIIKTLENDSRCCGIGLLVSGIAEKRFTDHTESRGFSPVTVPDSSNVITQVLELTHNKPFDIGIGTVTSMNGPESLVLYAGKSSLKLKKLYFILEGWAGLGNSFTDGSQNLDELDGIFCNDGLAKKVVQKTLPNFPENKIFVTGTGQLDSLELDKAETYESETRQKLELGPDTIAILYLGGISSIISEQYDADEKIEEKTFSQVLDAICTAAQHNPQKKYAILLRTHPADPNKAEYGAIAEDKSLPDNVRYIKADPPLTINGICYAADLIFSTCSTENFKAHFRNKVGGFMAFDAPGMGYDFLQAMLGDNIVQAIAETEGTLIVKSPEELSDYLSKFEREKQEKNSAPSIQPTDSTHKILDIIFS